MQSLRLRYRDDDFYPDPYLITVLKVARALLQHLLSDFNGGHGSTPKHPSARSNFEAKLLNDINGDLGPTSRRPSARMATSRPSS